MSKLRNALLDFMMRTGVMQREFQSLDTNCNPVNGAASKPRSCKRCYGASMQLTLCKQSALAILRSLRAKGSASTGGSRHSSNHLTAGARRASSKRVDLLPPDPSPGKRWTRGLLESVGHDLPFEFAGKTLDFAVPDGSSRIRVSDSTWTVFSKGIPKGAFIRTRCSTDDCVLAISSPELLFVELAKYMHPVEHLMLGHELCGSFSRDAEDPYNGPITYGVQPATSVERIRHFLDEARNIHGIEAARTTLEYLNDNAWSPTESLVAALLRLPMDSLGYGFGELVLNPRVSPRVALPGTASSRVPDIIIAGTPVGVNYDGAVHLDLDSIVNAAREVETNPQLLQAQESLSKAVRSVRAKVVDDIRRNRELAADGFAVFPVVKEDLYPKGGLDQIVAHLVSTIEQLTHCDMTEQKKILRMKRLADARWRMALSLMPGKHERSIHVGRFICGHEVVEGSLKEYESWIEL